MWTQMTGLQDVPEAHGKSFSADSSVDPGAGFSLVAM